MSSFVPLNFIEDPSVSKKDLEEQHTRELQVEQGFKLFQKALLFQKKSDYVQAYKIYEELFLLDVISNHYSEEEAFLRGIQNGSQNSSVDELSLLSPNLKSLRYLIFRNRGFLYLDILREHNEAIMKEINLKDSISSTVDYKTKSKDLFYTMLDDFCIALLYNEGDEKLLETLYQMYMTIGSTRLARFTVEYSLNSREESDELAGLLPISDLARRRFNHILGKLHVNNTSTKNTDLELSLQFLEAMKQDFTDQQLESKKKKLMSIECAGKGGKLNWSDILDSINKYLKDNQDNSKVEDVYYTRLKFLEPYILTEESFDIVELVISQEEKAMVVTEPIPTVSSTDSEDKILEKDELKKVDDDVTNDSKQIQRSSKRLAKTETSTEIPEIILERKHFGALNTFMYPCSNSSQSSKSKDKIDDNSKLLDLLSEFGGGTNQTEKKMYRNISEIETSDKIIEFVKEMNRRKPNFEEAKLSIIRHLLGTDETALIIESEWDAKLYNKVKDWVVEFEIYIYDLLNTRKPSIGDLKLAVSLFEVLVDCSISLELHIKDLIKTKSKFNKAIINSLSQDLLKLNDKINRWSIRIDDHFHDLGTHDEIGFVLECRFRWGKIIKEKYQTASWNEDQVIRGMLEQLLKLVTSSKFKIAINYPNYANFMELTLDGIQNQLTMVSVLSIFWRILYSEPHNGSTEAILLLEDILISTERSENEAITSIKEFLNVSAVEMRLSLWGILLSFYNSNDKWKQLLVGFHHCLHFLCDYLTGRSYEALDTETRFNTLLRVIGFYADSVTLLLTSIENNGWRLGVELSENDLDFSILFMFFELCLLFETHEQASFMTSLRSSIRERSLSSYEKLKDILLKTVVLMLALLKDSFENEEQNFLKKIIKLFHAQLGASGICSASQGIFLAISQEYLSELPESDEDIAQVILCRYHYNININGFIPVDHFSERKDELDENDCKELSKFVLPFCFKNNPMVNTPKHEIKSLIDEIYNVVGDLDFESNEVLNRNNACLEYFLESTLVTPRFARDAFHGLIDLNMDKIGTYDFLSGGLYFLQGLLIFASYKIRKKNMQSRAVELENVVALLTSDLVSGNNRVESWFLLAQAYGFLVEDDLIWTSDKLTVIERKIATANIQRKALICYLMAINGSINESSTERIKPIVGSLMSSFAKEMFSACMELMDMHAFRVLPHAKFIRKPSGASSITMTNSSVMTKSLCLKIIQQSLHLAINSNTKDWLDYYYLSKVQRKLNKAPSLVLDTMRKACKMSFKFSKASDCVVEPHYALVSLTTKYVKQDLISTKLGVRLLVTDPIIQIETEESDFSKKEYYKLACQALRKLDSFDKKNWQHKAKYRLAKILYEEFEDVDGAIEQMSSFVSLRATNKALLSIWKPEQERPGKHFYYTFQYIQFYIELLKAKKDLIGLIVMLPKLRRSNSIMVNLYTAWEGLCASICKLIRQSLHIGDVFTETIINNLSYQAFTINIKSFMELMEQKGIPEDLHPHLCFLYSINDMKKFNNGFGPTSLIDDTIVGIYFKIYLHFFKDLDVGHSPALESPGAKKKIAKRDIFPLTNDILKQFKAEIEAVLKEKPDIYNDFVRSSQSREVNDSVIIMEEEPTSTSQPEPNGECSPESGKVEHINGDQRSTPNTQDDDSHQGMITKDSLDTIDEAKTNDDETIEPTPKKVKYSMSEDMKTAEDETIEPAAKKAKITMSEDMIYHIIDDES
ncbi:HIR3 [[Candida] subhashii]|uniref:HIR3 n=1 Tax=[Candida] subhashii TaxID=561895 RepID=A0A8J5QH19_9ASCO|nr:HIR3 [[Candida] subhashii]KAG7661245.1 HIR3 [[Candida] subhashii]